MPCACQRFAITSCHDDDHHCNFGTSREKQLRICLVSLSHLEDLASSGCNPADPLVPVLAALDVPLTVTAAKGASPDLGQRPGRVRDEALLDGPPHRLGDQVHLATFLGPFRAVIGVPLWGLGADQ